MSEELLFSSLIDSNQEELEDDLELLKKYYPREMLSYQEIIEQECDKLEYDGSPMYAKVPDKAGLERIAGRITKQIMEQNSERSDVQVQERGGGLGPSFPPVPMPPYQQLFPCILTMLCNEIYIRRCRRSNRCRLFRNY